MPTSPGRDAGDVPAREALSESARGGVRSLIFRALTAVSDTLVLIVTARGFGAEGRGVYTLASFAVSSLVLIAGGAQFPMRTEIGRKRTSVAALRAASIVMAGVVLGTALLLVPALLVIWPDTDVPVWAALATAFVLLTQFQWSLYQAQGDVRRMLWVILMRSVIPLLGLAAVAFASPGDIELAMLVWAACQVVVPGVTVSLWTSDTRLRFRGLGPLVKRLVRRGIPVSAASAAGLVGYRMDLVVVAAFLPVADVGRYSVAMAAGEALFLVSRSVLTGVYAPMIGSELQESIRVTLRAFRHTIALLVPLGALTAAAAWVLAEPFLGEGFADAGPLIAILIPGFVAVAMNELLANFFIVRLERTRGVLITYLVVGALNVTVGSVLVNLIGLPGAAVATSVSYTLAAAYFVIWFAREGGPRRPSEYLPTVAELRDYRNVLSAAIPPRLRRST